MCVCVFLAYFNYSFCNIIIMYVRVCQGYTHNIQGCVCVCRGISGAEKRSLGLLLARTKTGLTPNMHETKLGCLLVITRVSLANDWYRLTRLRRYEYAPCIAKYTDTYTALPRSVSLLLRTHLPCSGIYAFHVEWGD